MGSLALSHLKLGYPMRREAKKSQTNFRMSLDLLKLLQEHRYPTKVSLTGDLIKQNSGLRMDLLYRVLLRDKDHQF